MEDLYGLLLILGFLIIISQCTSSQIKEKMSNKTNTPVIPATIRVKHDGPVDGNYPDEVLLASANTPYGFDIPISMQQEYTTLKSFGKVDQDVSGYLETIRGASVLGKPTDSQLPMFDPSSKGGLLPSQKQKAPGSKLFNVGNDTSSLKVESDKMNVDSASMYHQPAAILSPPSSRPSSPTPTGNKWIVYGSQSCGWTVKQLKYMKENNISHDYIDCKQQKGACPKWVNGFPSLVSPSGEETSGYKEM
jgi:hypothetical protein